MKMHVGEAHHFEWLKGIIGALFSFNVLDGILTIHWILERRASEANPLMASLIDVHPVLFMTGKLTLVLLGSVLLWRLRRQPLAVCSLFAVFLVYYFVILYHLQAMDFQMVRRWLA